jgi:hypothetical protein
MSNYRITATQFAVYPEETTYCDPDATIVSLLGELGEDEHFSIRQGDHVIYLDPEELEPLLVACKRLRGQSAQESPVDTSAAEQEPSEASTREPAPAVVVRGVDGTLIDPATGEPVVAWML